jgi:hypothetical protein
MISNRVTFCSPPPKINKKEKERERDRENDHKMPVKVITS